MENIGMYIGYGFGAFVVWRAYLDCDTVALCMLGG
jgi:hypothetical protein